MENVGTTLNRDSVLRNRAGGPPASYGRGRARARRERARDDPDYRRPRGGGVHTYNVYIQSTSGANPPTNYLSAATCSRPSRFYYYPFPRHFGTFLKPPPHTLPHSRGPNVGRHRTHRTEERSAAAVEGTARFGGPRGEEGIRARKAIPPGRNVPGGTSFGAVAEGPRSCSC